LATALEGEVFGRASPKARPGRIELAQRGTLFLGEIGCLPPALQFKLVALLREGHGDFERGGQNPDIDVRLIAGSSKPLRRLAREGIVTNELYAWLSALCIDMPPLRRRPEDILLLATHFAGKHAVHGEPAPPITPTAMLGLVSYRWPGNVRELEAVIDRACSAAGGGPIDAHHLPSELAGPALEPMACQVSLERPLPQLLREVTATIERQYLRKALRRVHGNVVKAAMICGLSRRSVTAKIAEYGINRGAFKQV
jgi:DNA-binding NtrC family response regulator